MNDTKRNWTQKEGTVIVPFDFSDPSTEALHVANDFVKDPAQVLVIHVLAPLLVTEPGVVWNTLDEEHARNHATESLQKTLKKLGHEQFRSEVSVGDAAHTILERAEQEKAELIVIPTHGRTGIKRFVMGSVAERVVRFAHCPVLVLRQAPKK